MTISSFFGESSQLAFERPNYLPLQGQSADQAINLLLRKGAQLKPPMTKAEAQGIIAFMSLEHFRPGSVISFSAQSEEVGRTSLIIAGEANIRMRSKSIDFEKSANTPVTQVQSKWFNVGEGATLGLVHVFSGLSSQFVAQAVTELFVASLSRLVFQQMKKQEPLLALRYLEITALELSLIALDHEQQIVALSNVARSLQEHISEETGETDPTASFG
jgi:hypothetical protein